MCTRDLAANRITSLAGVQFSQTSLTGLFVSHWAPHTHVSLHRSIRANNITSIGATLFADSKLLNILFALAAVNVLGVTVDASDLRDNQIAGVEAGAWSNTPSLQQLCVASSLLMVCDTHVQADGRQSEHLRERTGRGFRVGGVLPVPARVC